MALFCKQSGTRKIAIDPILKDEILIENFLLYYGEYKEPATEDIWLTPVPCSVTVAAYSPYSYWPDVMVDPRLLRASPAATLSQPATQQKNGAGSGAYKYWSTLCIAQYNFMFISITIKTQKTLLFDIF